MATYEITWVGSAGTHTQEVEASGASEARKIALSGVLKSPYSPKIAAVRKIGDRHAR